jgi:enoyl-CoA hydratase
MTVRAHVDGLVGTVIIDNPPLNVMGSAVRAQIIDAVADFRARGVRAIVVTGAGTRAFCAGADLNEERALTPATVQAFLDADEVLFSALEDYPGGVIAAVNGHAYGGGFELALSCDIRIAAASARLAGVGITIGLAVSTARLPRLVGEAVAKDLLLTGRAVSAGDALALGLVSAVVPDDTLMSEAKTWADTIASRAPLSVRANKVGLRHCARLPLDEAVAYERGEWARLQRTRDHVEALHAFFEKRTPNFTGA